MLGADEAGKGPVLGPMVAGAVRASPDRLPDGVADSKRLSASDRERLAERLRSDEAVATATAVVPVAAIDAPETDMNELGVAGQAVALRCVARDGDRAVVDAADVSAERFGDRLQTTVAATDGDDADPHPLLAAGDGDPEGVAPPSEVDVTAEHGADDRYDLVAAASILAKVERDRRMAAIDERYDRPVGSGYPSDETTREFLAAYVTETGSLPECARASWQTARDALAAAAQSGLDDF
ncbi:ribonuclease HII [Halobaculum sp. MBLA0147]|uniref:ribonuclease HII n=1 Tax=Halobaculum sp. MBLA0147 TaxID=3079934 RepID=UPI0035232F04